MFKFLSSLFKSPDPQTSVILENPFMPKGTINHICPYCKVDLPKPAKRRSVCKQCNNRFYVRNFNTVTIPQKIAIDIFDHTFFLFENETDLIQEISMYLDNPNRSEEDLHWSILQKALLLTDEPWKKVSAYKQLARILKGSNKDYSHIIELAKPYIRAKVNHDFGILTKKEKDEIYKDELSMFDFNPPP